MVLSYAARVSDDGLVEAAENVFLVRGSAVNWILLRDGTDLTLVDGGYPGDLGAVNPFHSRYGTPAYFDPAEVGHAHRDYLEQLTPATLVANLWRPRVLPWAVRIVRNGATQDVAAPHAQPLPSTGALDLPGGPVPIPAHGHGPLHRGPIREAVAAARSTS